MYSVLIVDDEKIVKLAIKSMIKWGDSGFELAGTASDGARALQICEKSPPDIVITDLKMPHMDGIEFIKKLKQMDYGGEILVLSNYNDFELVREAMKYGAHDYILKVTVKSDDFMRVLEEIKEKLIKKRGYEKIVPADRKDMDLRRNEAIRELLAAGEDQLAERTGGIPEILGMEEDCRLQIFAAACKDEETLKKTGQSLSDIIRNITGNIFGACNWQAVAEYEPNTVFIAVNMSAASDIMKSKEAADRILELSNMYFNLRIGIVYGEPVKDKNSVLNEMAKCKKALELLFYESFNGTSILNDRLPVNDEKRVREAALPAVENIYSQMIAGHTENVMKSFEGIIAEGAGSLLNPYRLKKLVKRVLRDVEKKLINNGYCGDEVFDEYDNDEDIIFSAASQSGLLAALGNIVETAALRTGNQRNYRREVREALRYIEENISRKISVPQIAKTVSMTDTYLCRIFKTDVGKSIIDYINELKMKKAYELLDSKDCLIKEAAAAVGIDDQFYFNRLFKKYFGITPKEIKHRP